MGDNLKSMRKHVEEHYGYKVPDEFVISDSPDYFSYIAPSGAIAGWNRNTEFFWRNRNIDDTQTP